MDKTKHFRIFSADDDSDDQDLLEEALISAGLKYDLLRFPNGLLLLQHLSVVARNPLTRPDIIFLDLNMPVINGREVLKEIKNENFSGAFPVVILTTSNAREDKLFCIENGADAYLVKPNSFSDLIRLVEKSLRDVVLKSGSSTIDQLR